MARRCTIAPSKRSPAMGCMAGATFEPQWKCEMIPFMSMNRPRRQYEHLVYQYERIPHTVWICHVHSVKYSIAGMICKPVYELQSSVINSINSMNNWRRRVWSLVSVNRRLCMKLNIKEYEAKQVWNMRMYVWRYLVVWNVVPACMKSKKVWT